MRKVSRYLNGVIVLALVMTVPLMSGCEPLRKKFTRKKKETQAKAEMPVFEPIDYPAKVEDPKTQCNSGMVFGAYGIARRFRICGTIARTSGLRLI